MGTLYDRIRNAVKSILRPLNWMRAPIEEVTEQERQEADEPLRAGYLQQAEAVSIINKAGRQQLLVQLSYSGVTRYVEPYSFRYGKRGLLFYGHDLFRNDTRSYYVDNIEFIEMTDIPFTPRWLIEVG